MKREALTALRIRVEMLKERLRAVDNRLLWYLEDVARNEPDEHNLHEVLCALKFVRVFGKYPFEVGDVQVRIRCYEGRWSESGGVMRHVEGSGGLQFSGLHGRTYYRLTPIQVFMLAGIYGPHHWVDTGATAGSRVLLKSERVMAADGRAAAEPLLTEKADGGDAGADGRDGIAPYGTGEGEGANGERLKANVETIWDYRRLVTEAVLFIPRKFGKTTFGAFFQFEGFFFGDYNFEGYCCANSADQAKILFNMTADLIHQLDPDEERIRFTAKEINWKKGQARQAKVTALSAGGKTKDGLFAQYCSSDEYGSAPYVNGHSDMGSLVNVVEGSMGPRREHLTIHTTTAGNVNNGPFEVKLRGMKAELEKEVSLKAGEEGDNDWQFAVILQPDEWETDEETIFSTPRIWKKVNPHIGITVQNDYYESEIAKSRQDPEKKKEVVTKLFNVFQSDRVMEWVKPELIRKCQVSDRIDNLKASDGWVFFTGMDFSQGDDLHVLSYLCVNKRRSLFFADMDAWVTEESLNNSPIRELLRSWADAGWLHVCPGRVLEPELPVNRIIQLSDHISPTLFGYDPYHSKQVVNSLSAWVVSYGLNPQQCILPIKQTYAYYSPSVDELDYLIKHDPPLIRFSPNPMWPWEFGNCQLAVSNDTMENKKPVKANPGSSSCKVDNVQALCTAISLFDLADGRVNK